MVDPSGEPDPRARGPVDQAPEGRQGFGRVLAGHDQRRFRRVKRRGSDPSSGGPDRGEWPEPDQRGYIPVQAEARP